MALITQKFYLDEWLVDPNSCQLVRRKQTHIINSELMHLLCFIVENRIRPISSRELARALDCPEQSISHKLIQLRACLGDTHEKNQYIESLDNNKYQLIAKIKFTHRNSSQKHPVVFVSSLIFGAILIGLIFFWSFNGNLIPNFEQKIISSTDSATSSIIIVYPFAESLPSAQDTYFAKGLSEHIRSSLSKLPSLTVLSRTTTETIQYNQLTNNEVRKQFNVGVVLKGTIKRSTDQVLIYLALENTLDNSVLWETTLHAPAEDIFSIQDKIVSSIAHTLKLNLVTSYDKSNISIQAFDSYLLGRFYWNKRTPDDIDKSIRYFERAITLAPNFALAYTGLADAYLFRSTYGGKDRDEALKLAESALKRALNLNPDLAEAYASFAQIFMKRHLYKDSEVLFKRAIEINPNYVSSYHWYGILMNNIGSHDKAITLFQKALKLDPLSPMINRNIAFTYLLNGQRFNAVRYMDYSLTLNPATSEKSYLNLNIHPLDYTSAINVIQFIKHNIRLIPETVPHKITLALLAVTSNNIERAEQLTHQAEILFPYHPRILDAKIAITAAKNQWSELAPLIQQRIQTQPHNNELQLHLAYAYFLSDQKERLEQVLESANSVLSSNARFQLLKLQVQIEKDPAFAAPGGTQKMKHKLELGFDEVSIEHASLLNLQGFQDDALSMLGSLVDNGWIHDASQQWWSLNDEPAFQSLKTHPRFISLIDTINQKTSQMSLQFKTIDL